MRYVLVAISLLVSVEAQAQCTVTCECLESPCGDKCIPLYTTCEPRTQGSACAFSVGPVCQEKRDTLWFTIQCDFECDSEECKTDCMERVGLVSGYDAKAAVIKEVRREVQDRRAVVLEVGVEEVAAWTTGRRWPWPVFIGERPCCVACWPWCPPAALCRTFEDGLLGGWR